MNLNSSASLINVVGSEKQSSCVQQDLAKSKLCPLPVFTYDLENMIDPFIPLVNAPAYLEVLPKSSKDSSVSLNSFEPFNISSLRLTGIVFTKKNKMVLLEEVDGKGHQVSVGSYIGKNRAVVTNIFKDRILIKELLESGHSKIRTIKLPSH